MKLWQVVKEKIVNAIRVRVDDARRDNNERCCLHSFSSQRERALSDIRRVRMLVEASQNESSGASNSGAANSLRELRASLGRMISKRTGESEVYWNAAENCYYKIKNPAAKAYLKRTTEKDWIYEHIVHNILFPETYYELIAIDKEHDELRLVLKQKCVSTETYPSVGEVERYLRFHLGLKEEDRYWFGNDFLAITDVSETSDNVLKGDDGKLYFIDPLIRLKKSALDVIEELTTVKEF